MKTLLIVGTILLAISLLSNRAAQAEEWQGINPLFVEAHELWQQADSSTLNDNTKNALRTRFDTLEQEQRKLWRLVGQIEEGQCRDECIDLYDSDVVSWEISLKSFIHDAKLLLSSVENSEK